jgi:hypothetical protein
MYKCKYFSLSELAHPQIIAAIGSVNTWRRLDAEVLQDLDYIREEWYLIHRSGIYINRLNLGLDSRGLRPPNDPDGSFYSTHKEGNTFDLEPVNGQNESLYNFIAGLIKAGKLKALNTLEAFECTGGWIHAGKMNTEERPLIIYV